MHMWDILAFSQFLGRHSASPTTVLHALVIACFCGVHYVCSSRTTWLLEQFKLDSLAADGYTGLYVLRRYCHQAGLRETATGAICVTS